MNDSVINLRHDPELRRRLERDPVYQDVVLVDRRTEWGNPFTIPTDGDRDTVIALYRDDLWHRIRTGYLSLEDLADLDGMTLACWCDPLPCHGHVLARAARWAADRIVAMADDFTLRLA